MQRASWKASTIISRNLIFLNKIMADTQIIIFGEVLFDSFPDGSAVLGGAPFNVAWHLQALGTAPLFISCVGDDAQGERIKTAMADWGMDLNGLQTNPDHPTGQVTVNFVDNEPSYDIVNQSAYDYIQPDRLPDIHGRPLLYHGSLALRNPVSAGTLLTVKRKTAPYVFLDVNLRSPWWRLKNILPLLNDTSWLKLNHHELAELVPNCPNEEKRISQLFSSTSLKTVTLTRGDKGATTYRLKGSTSISVFPKTWMQVKDTVGAGDAFSSVLLLGFIRGWDIKTTLKRAQKFAGEIIGVQGAIIKDETFYKPFITSWK